MLAHVWIVYFNLALRAIDNSRVLPSVRLLNVHTAAELHFSVFVKLGAGGFCARSILKKFYTHLM